MTGDLVEAKASSPTRSPKSIGSAVMLWACTRRARMMLLTAVFCAIWMGLVSMKNNGALSSRYYFSSSYYPWSLQRPSLPGILDSSFKTPSNLTLQLENGQVNHIPSRLKKTTPNFHLIMPSDRDTDGFCKATLSAMVLNYPPPTVVQLRPKQSSSEQRQQGILRDTLHYLSNKKLVKDHDLVLIVDAHDARFQLPGDVIIEQYKQLLVDDNARLLKRYGRDKNGLQRFNQTILFGAEKMCDGNDMACKHVPQSVFTDDLYRNETGSRRIQEMPAKYLNSKMVMGPASDLRALYQAAQKRFEEQKSQSQTVQSVFATLFAEQQLSRDAFEVETKSSTARIKHFIQSRLSNSAAKRRLDQVRTELSNFTRQEFSMGLDYTHSLFQPLAHTTTDELVPITHDNSTDLSKYTRHGPDTQYLSLPASLASAKPPFSRPGFTQRSPSPNTKSSHIDNLAYTLKLDNLPDRTVPWRTLSLIQNTFTGAIPAVLLSPTTTTTTSTSSPTPAQPPSGANITLDTDLWYTPHKRALLRAFFRAPQSPTGYHDAAVGGDRHWDVRGGRGGVWTADQALWMPWGEVDGVCGTVDELRDAFADGKGVWLHEMEDKKGERSRKAKEMALKMGWGTQWKRDGD